MYLGGEKMDFNTFSMFFFFAFIAYLLLLPTLKNKAKVKEYDTRAKRLRELGYRYDWDKYNKIQQDVMEDRNKNPEKYPSLHEYGKEINRRCEAEKLLNKSDLERK